MSNSHSSTTDNSGEESPNQTKRLEGDPERNSPGFKKPHWLDTGPLDPEIPDKSPIPEDSWDETTVEAEGNWELGLTDTEQGQPGQESEEEAQHPVEIVTARLVDPSEETPSAPITDDPPEDLMESLEGQPNLRKAQLEEQPEFGKGEPEEQPEIGEGEPGEQPEEWEGELEEQIETWAQALVKDDDASRSADPHLNRPMIDLIPVPDHSAAIENDEFVVEPSEKFTPAIAKPSPQRRAAKPVRARKQDRWTTGLFLLSILLLSLAAAIYFLNPFTRLALYSATIAQPSSASAAALPQAGSGNWCVQGNFQNGAGQPRLADGGSQGDILSGDGVFSLNYSVAQPGAYIWQVVDCDNPDLAFPENAAWFNTTEANQPVTFIFDSTQRNNAIFPSVPYIVSAIDNTSDYRLVGSFQGWNEGDVSGKLERISDGLYQQIRRIAVPDAHEAYFLSADPNQTIDATGRTSDPTPFAFETERPGEYVLFLLDSDRGQATVLYDMPPMFTSLAFGNGNMIVSYLLAGLAALLILFALWRLVILRNDSLRMESGCPSCGQQELMRTSRHWQQRLQNNFGIPAYRYRCRNCTWEGTRLSDKGEAISPGALFVRSDIF